MGRDIIASMYVIILVYNDTIAFARVTIFILTQPAEPLYKDVLYAMVGRTMLDNQDHACAIFWTRSASSSETSPFHALR